MPLHVGGVLDPSQACRNSVTLSIDRQGHRQRIQLGLENGSSKSESEESIQMEDDVQVSGGDRRSDCCCCSDSSMSRSGRPLLPNKNAQFEKRLTNGLGKPWSENRSFG